MKKANFKERNIIVKGKQIHVIESGDTSKPAILFIHGWPTNWKEFEQVMNLLSDKYYVLALDIPGIGESTDPLDLYSKRNIADYIYKLLDLLNINQVNLVGADVGGQIVYAFLKKYQKKVLHAVIMNVAIPSVDPWESVERNPYIWHFAFHAIPNLPEKLVMGNQKTYFSYFYDTLSAKKDKFPENYRNIFSSAYSDQTSLAAGFELYRSFSKDIEDNINSKDIEVNVPLLYVRGDQEFVKIDDYLNGFKKFNFKKINSAILKNSGHFSAIEQPQELSIILHNFLNR